MDSRDDSKKCLELWRKHLEAQYDYPSTEFSNGFESGLRQANEEIAALRKENYELRQKGTCQRLENEILRLKDTLRTYRNTEYLEDHNKCLKCKNFRNCFKEDPSERSGCPYYDNYCDGDHIHSIFSPKFEENPDYTPTLYKGYTGWSQGEEINLSGDRPIMYNDMLKRFNEFIHYFYSPNSCISIIARVDNNKTSVTEQEFLFVGDDYKYKNKGFGILNEDRSKAVANFKSREKLKKESTKYDAKYACKGRDKPWWEARAEEHTVHPIKNAIEAKKKENRKLIPEGTETIFADINCHTHTDLTEGVVYCNSFNPSDEAKVKFFWDNPIDYDCTAFNKDGDILGDNQPDTDDINKGE